MESVSAVDNGYTLCAAVTTFGNGCDTMTQLLYIFIYKYMVFCRRPVRRWFHAGKWCVPVGTVVVMLMDRIAQLQMAKFNLVAHMWPKDF